MTNTAKPNPPAEHAKRTEDEALAARHAANEIATAFENSPPAVMKRLLIGAAVPAYEYSSKKVKAQCEEHSAFVQSIKSQLEAGAAEVREALATCTESGDYGEVLALVENGRWNHGALATELVASWSKAVDLAEMVAADLVPTAVTLTAEADALLVEVKAELTELGSGLESQIAYPKNLHAAEQQFTFAARQNLRVRAAQIKANLSRSEKQAAAERAAATRRGLAAARSYLHKIVLAAVTQ